MPAVVRAVGAAFCAATGPTTRAVPRTRAAVRPSPLICLIAMLLSPRYMVECVLVLQRLRVGVYGPSPVNERGSKAANDIRPLRRTHVNVLAHAPPLFIEVDDRLSRRVVV